MTWTRCTGGVRHRFGDSNTCKRCGFNRWNSEFRSSPVVTPPEEKKTRPDVPLTGTEVKLQHATNLVTAYTEAREELVRFMSQHSKEVKTFEDPLEEMTALFLRTLYEDYGRELFWRTVRGTEDKMDVAETNLAAKAREAGAPVWDRAGFDLPHGHDSGDV